MKKLDKNTRKKVTEDAATVYSIIKSTDGELDMEDIDYLVALREERNSYINL